MKNNKSRHRKRGGSNIIGSLFALGKGVTERTIEGGIQTTGEYLGVDTNKTTEELVDEIKDGVNDPKTQRIIGDVSEITASAFKAAKPGIDKMLDEGESMAKDLGKRAIVIGQELISEIPIIGPIIELPFLISNVVRAGEKVIESGAKITGIGVQTLDEFKREYDEGRAKLSRDLRMFDEQINTHNNESQDAFNRALESKKQFQGVESRQQTAGSVVREVRERTARRKTYKHKRRGTGRPMRHKSSRRK